MRVADKMAFNQLNRSLSKNRTEMARLQDEAATQKRVTRPSDDPLASHRILAARTELRGIDQFKKNIAMARTFLETSDQALGELTDVLVRAKELAIYQASDGGSTEESRRVTALETEQLRWQAIQIANRKIGNRYIFAGHKTDQAPFANDGSYRGDAGDIKIQIDKDSFLPMNLPGSGVFLGQGLSRDGTIRADFETPTTLDQVRQAKERLHTKESPEEQDDIIMRELASVEEANGFRKPNPGIDVFTVLKHMEVSLMTSDKEGIQMAIDEIDEALNQVINARAQVGARVGSLERTLEAMEKAKHDHTSIKSEMEDADIFQVVSDITKTESALQATLQTSGKLIQPSLLDFLR